MKKIIKVVNNCFIGIMIIFFLILLFINFSSDSNNLSKLGNYSLFDVNGDSMYPKVKNGDLIAVNTKKKDRYNEGDIISFIKNISDGSMIITHEIIDVKENYYVTKGVNNEDSDDFVVYDGEVIGEYNGFRIPLIGYVCEFSRTSLGYMILVVLPLGIIFLFSIYELLKEISKKKGEA